MYFQHALILPRGGLTAATHCDYESCRGTSLIRNNLSVGPYSSPMPRDLWWVQVVACSPMEPAASWFPSSSLRITADVSLWVSGL